MYVCSHWGHRAATNPSVGRTIIYVSLVSFSDGLIPVSRTKGHPESIRPRMDLPSLAYYLGV